MKIVIGQPKLESELNQLELTLTAYPEADVVIFPEGYINANLEQARKLARMHHTAIISGYKNPKDWSVVIDASGDLLLNRAKYEAGGAAEVNGQRIAHLLCDELVLQGLKEQAEPVDMIAHPIGVGMFSEEQFEEWITVAKNIAKQHHALIIGTSHADGSYRDSAVSIPIAYCIDPDGREVFIRKNDTRTVLLDTETMQYIVSEAVYR
ncbi:hypothetical protein MUG84_16110 [Paenibacillus sp. KQZ6P-2]|uniref:CN hydrolase domain-containing protein n=1 Tax=Paenibacillus mangrovi TaxID=2931978 RepID=A0A9X1WRB2_9BACL|nr:hypothetical protein [Paenibacillus mangrovi]MCJ8013256.1 hypothetical protein [Paenibacillus mangrovi]